MSKIILVSAASVPLLALTAHGFVGVTNQRSAPRKLNVLSSSGSSVNDPWGGSSSGGRSSANYDPWSGSSSANGSGRWSDSNRSGGGYSSFPTSANTRRGTSAAASSSSWPPSAYTRSNAAPARQSTGRSSTVQFMITNQMKRVLIEDLRYTRNEVSRMDAESAASIVAGRISRPSPPNGYTNGEESTRRTVVPAAAVVAETMPQNNIADDSAAKSKSSPPNLFPLEGMEDEFGIAERVLHAPDPYGSLFSNGASSSVGGGAWEQANDGRIGTRRQADGCIVR